MRSRTLALALSSAGILGAALLDAPASFAADPSPDQLIKDMKEAIEPSKPSTRVMELTAVQGGESQTLKLIQARKAFSDGPRALTFLIEPEAARGMAYLVEEHTGKPNPVEYVYVPMVRRVRKLVPAENYRTFMDTDFTYGDLGFLPLDATNTLVGSDTVNGKKAYKVQSVPNGTAKQWYYSKYVTWIDADSSLPVKREFYSPAGQVFKTETFDAVTVFDGVPTPTKITMQDRDSNTTSELKVLSVSYNNEIPDSFFTPAELPKLSKAGNEAEKAAMTKASR